MSADIWPSILLMCHISFANLYRLNHPCFLGWILIYLVHPVDSEKKKNPRRLCDHSCSAISPCPDFLLLFNLLLHVSEASLFRLRMDIGE